jgi:integrase/recombinase XerD
MSTEIAKVAPAGALAPTTGGPIVPEIIADAGEHATRRFVEFFTATIRNANTRHAYARAVRDFFAWIAGHRIALAAIEPVHVAAYIEQLQQRAEKPLAAPSVKQHLAAIKMLFDWLVTGQVVPFNPATSVRGPRHIVKRGKTPVLIAEEARQLLDSIPLKIGPQPKQGEPDNRPHDLSGLRDRALIGVMVYSFARVSAALDMTVADYFVEGRKAWFRLHEKGGKRHEVPSHHNAADYLDAYVAAAGIGDDRKGPLFRSAEGKTGKLTDRPMHRNDALRMIKRRAKAAGLSVAIGNHTFRATGITAFRDNGGSLEEAQEIANHASPKTTMLYDRSRDQITLDAVERIII